MAALLASLLALESLFRADLEDGTTEQCCCPVSRSMLRWPRRRALAVCGLPLVMMSPFVATGLGVPTDAVGTAMVSLLSAPARSACSAPSARR